MAVPFEKVVPVKDTRKSTLLTPTPKAVDTRQSSITPTRRSGGGSSTRDVTPQEVQQIERTSQSARAEQIVQQIEQSRKPSPITNPLAQSSNRQDVINRLVQSQYESSISQTKSTAYPSARAVANAQVSGKVTPQQASLTYNKIVQGEGERYARDIAKDISNQAQIKIKSIVNSEEQRLQQIQNDLQRRADEGADVKELNKILAEEQYQANKRIREEQEFINVSSQKQLKDKIKEWESTTGRSLSNRAGVSVRSAERLNRLTVKNVSGKALGGFAVGVPTGGLLSAGMQVAGKTISKGVGTTLGLFGSAVALGSGLVTAGKQVKSGEIQPSEFWSEAGTLAVERGSAFVGGSVGGLVGGYAYQGGSNYLRTGNIKGINPNEQLLAERSINKNGFRIVSSKGSITDTELRKISISQEGKTELSEALKSGNIVRKITLKPDTTGLSTAERSALNKYGLKVDTYVIVDKQGNIIRSVELTRITGKAPITRIQGGSTDIISSTKGVINNGKFVGVREGSVLKGLSIREQASRSVLSTARQNQQQRLSSVFKEEVVARGEVKVNDGLRLERSIGASRTTERYDVLGTRILKNPEKTISVSKQSTISRKIMEGLGFSPKSAVRGETFIDIKSTGKSLSSKENIFSISRKPSNAFRQLPEPKITPSNQPKPIIDEPLLDIKPTSGSTTVTTQKSDYSFGGSKYQESLTDESLNFLPQSSMIKGQSISIIKSTPTTTSFNSLAIANPKIKIDESQGLLSSTSINDERLFKEPRGTSIIGIKNIFARPTVKPTNFARQSPALSSDVAVINNQQQKSRSLSTLTIQKPSLTNKPFSPFEPSVPFFGIPPFKGRIEVGGGGFSTPQRGGIFGRTKYNPSLGSVLLGYKQKTTSKNIQRLGKQTFTGIGLRPILELEETKKKKKNKK